MSADILRVMFGLEVGTDLSALEGCVLESISISRHQVQLRLDSLRNLAVAVEGDFSVAAPDGEVVVYVNPADAAQALAGRLGAEVVAAVVKAPGTLTLRFGDGSTFEAFDSEDSYESYQIRLGERLIVV